MELIKNKSINNKLKKVMFSLIIFVTIFMYMSKVVYAGVLNGLDNNGKEFVFSYNGTGVHTSQIVTILNNYYGYKGTELSENMKLNTSATVSKVNEPFFGVRRYNI